MGGITDIHPSPPPWSGGFGALHSHNTNSTQWRSQALLLKTVEGPSLSYRWLSSCAALSHLPYQGSLLTLGLLTLSFAPFRRSSGCCTTVFDGDGLPECINYVICMGGFQITQMDRFKPNQWTDSVSEVFEHLPSKYAPTFCYTAFHGVI